MFVTVTYVFYNTTFNFADFGILKLVTVYYRPLLFAQQFYPFYALIEISQAGPNKSQIFLQILLADEVIKSHSIANYRRLTQSTRISSSQVPCPFRTWIIVISILSIKYQ